MDVRERAQELADSLSTSKEYMRLKEARDAVEQHQAAKVMLRDFHKKQTALQQQQAEGKQVTESQTEELHKLYEVLSINPYIRDLFEAEFVFSGLMMEVQEIIGKALGLEPEDNIESNEDELKAPQKKLWTPGN